MRPVLRIPRAPHRRAPIPPQAPPFAGIVLSFLLSLFLILPNVAVSAGIHADDVVIRTNAVRARYRVGTVRVDPALAAAAQRRAEELVAAAIFDHVRPDGAPFATAVADEGYPFERVAENLAIDYLNETPLLRGWLRSTNHRRALLGAEYVHIGIGVASGVIDGRPTTVTVQLLGRTLAPEFRGWIRAPLALPVG